MNPVTAACRLATAGPCHPGATTRPGMFSSRGISKGSLAFTPPGHSPRLWPPDGTGALGLYPGLHTQLSRTQPRMPGRGRASGTSPGSRRRHQRPPSTDPLNTSGLMSQFIWKVPSARDGQDSRQAPSFQAKGTFLLQVVSPANFTRKLEANPESSTMCLSSALFCGVLQPDENFRKSPQARPRGWCRARRGWQRTGT